MRTGRRSPGARPLGLAHPSPVTLPPSLLGVLLDRVADLVDRALDLVVGEVAAGGGRCGLSELLDRRLYVGRVAI